ncbi:MAG: hypothetical protein LBQ91_01900 [Oscillospiraceae bacterium]|jgi:hypothetical protein|nr:hypothetical protein [Oscillospiraceae bacterium]
MARKQKANPRIQLLTRLFAAGIKTSSAILRFGLTDIGKLPGITAEELHLLSALQTAVRCKQLYEFLAEGEPAAEPDEVQS